MLQTWRFLAPYNNSLQIKPLPFEVLLENESVLAYSLSNSSIEHKVISNRGPIIAQLVEGDQVLIHDEKTEATKVLKKLDTYILNQRVHSILRYHKIKTQIWCYLKLNNIVF